MYVHVFILILHNNITNIFNKSSSPPIPNSSNFPFPCIACRNAFNWILALWSKSIWDDDDEIFYPPKVYASWTKDPSTASWKCPVTYPSTTTYTDGSDTKQYNIGWNETLQRWEARLEKAIGNPTIYWNTSSSSWTDI